GCASVSAAAASAAATMRTASPTDRQRTREAGLEHGVLLAPAAIAAERRHALLVRDEPTIARSLRGVLGAPRIGDFGPCRLRAGRREAHDRKRRQDKSHGRRSMLARGRAGNRIHIRPSTQSYSGGAVTGRAHLRDPPRCRDRMRTFA